MALRCLIRYKNIQSLARQTFTVLPIVQNKNYSLIATRNPIFQHQQSSVNKCLIRNRYEKKSSPSSHRQSEVSLLNFNERLHNTNSRFKDSDDEEDEDFDKKTTAKVNVQSMRADLLLKTGVGIARNKIETAFYENRIRINGKKIAKKSLTVNIGDEIDLIKNESPTNPNHLVIARIEIVSATPREDGISVTMKRYKSLTVEKYEN